MSVIPKYVIHICHRIIYHIKLKFGCWFFPVRYLLKLPLVILNLPFMIICMILHTAFSFIHFLYHCSDKQMSKKKKSNCYLKPQKQTAGISLQMHVMWLQNNIAFSDQTFLLPTMYKVFKFFIDLCYSERPAEAHVRAWARYKHFVLHTFVLLSVLCPSKPLCPLQWVQLCRSFLLRLDLQNHKTCASPDQANLWYPLELPHSAHDQCYSPHLLV